MARGYTKEQRLTKKVAQLEAEVARLSEELVKERQKSAAFRHEADESSFSVQNIKRTTRGLEIELAGVKAERDSWKDSYNKLVDSILEKLSRGGE